MSMARPLCTWHGVGFSCKSRNCLDMRTYLVRTFSFDIVLDSDRHIALLFRDSACKVRYKPSPRKQCYRSRSLSELGREDWEVVASIWKKDSIYQFDLIFAKIERGTVETDDLWGAIMGWQLSSIFSEEVPLLVYKLLKQKTTLKAQPFIVTTVILCQLGVVVFELFKVINQFYPNWGTRAYQMRYQLPGPTHLDFECASMNCSIIYIDIY